MLQNLYLVCISLVVFFSNILLYCFLSNARRSPQEDVLKTFVETSSSELTIATDQLIQVKQSLRSLDQITVQLCSNASRGLLIPEIQLLKITDIFYSCIEHRTLPTTCFAKVPTQKPYKNKPYDDIEQYVNLWKPVLMMEIVTSAIAENDVIILFNLHANISLINGGFFQLFSSSFFVI